MQAVIVRRNLEIHPGDETDYSALTRVGGWLNVYKGATLVAPALGCVGWLDVREGATLVAPALTRVRWINVYKGATLVAPALTRVRWIDVREGATLVAPALARVDGWIYVHEGAALDAPALTSAGGEEVDPAQRHRLRSRYIARTMTEPHGRCLAAGRCIEPVPKDQRCRP